MDMRITCSHIHLFTYLYTFALHLCSFSTAFALKVPPVSNQFEINPFLFRKNTIDYFQKEGLVLHSYVVLSVLTISAVFESYTTII